MSDSKGLSGLASIASPVASALMMPGQYIMNQQNAEQQQRWTEKNMQQQMRNQTALMRLATPMAAQGLREAGINPATLAGGERPMSAPTAPQGAKADSVDFAASLEMAQLASTVKLNEASAKKLEAEAVAQQYQNKHTQTADDVFVQQLLSNMQEMVELYKSVGLDDAAVKVQKQYDELAANPDFDIGGFVGSMKAYEQQAGSLDNFTKRIEALIGQAGAYKLLKEQPTIYADIQMRKWALDAAQMYYLSSSADVNKATLDKLASEVKSLDQQVELYKSQGKLSDAQADQISNSDVNTLIHNDKIGEAVRAELVNGTNSFIHGAGQGAGFAAGAALTRGQGVLGAVGGVGSSRLGNLARSGVETFKHIPSPFKQGSKDAQTFDLLAHRIGENNARDILGKFLNSKERKRYNNSFYQWLGAYNNSHGRYPK